MFTPLPVGHLMYARCDPYREGGVYKHGSHPFSTGYLPRKCSDNPGVYRTYLDAPVYIYVGRPCRGVFSLSPAVGTLHQQADVVRAKAALHACAPTPLPVRIGGVAWYIHRPLPVRYIYPWIVAVFQGYTASIEGVNPNSSSL